MKAHYEIFENDDGSRHFAVTPGKVPNRTYDIILIVVLALIVFSIFGSNGIVQLFLSWIIIIAGGIWIYKNAIRWTGKVADVMPGGAFSLSSKGLETGTESLSRDEISAFVVQNYASDNKQPVSYTLYAESEDGSSYLVAGGLDDETSQRLLDDVLEAAGPRTETVEVSEAEPAMTTGDLLLCETTPGLYELRKMTVRGHETAVELPEPDNMVNSITFAKEFAGDTPLWFNKLADEEGVPILANKT